LFLALLLNAFARESLQDGAEKRGEKQPSKFYQGVQRLSRVLRLNSMISRRTQVKPTQSLAEDGPVSEKSSDSKGDFVYYINRYEHGFNTRTSSKTAEKTLVGYLQGNFLSAKLLYLDL